MKNKWDQRVYIDLYAGAGYSRIQGTSRFQKGSPVIALTVTHPFDKYIFCEEDKELLDALKARAQRIASRSEEHTSELQSPDHLVCRLLLEKKKKTVDM